MQLQYSQFETRTARCCASEVAQNVSSTFKNNYRKGFSFFSKYCQFKRTLNMPKKL